MTLDFLLTHDDTILAFLVADDGARLVVSSAQAGMPTVDVTWTSSAGGRTGRAMKTAAGPVEREAAYRFVFGLDLRDLRQAYSSPNIWERA